ncbi:MAG: winged helix-turn-helix domain-containing protein [Caldilineaceae bacterium]|nr:winged helix-turn-helix domain-containing protein [Caldilineaceae bacterium]
MVTLEQRSSWEPDWPWRDHPATYRSEEVRTLARWITIGASGSVVGLRGSGRSNLLGFLCHRPEALRGYLPPPAFDVLLVPVDLNNLPDPTLATFYRVLLRAFYEQRTRLPGELQPLTAQLFYENRAATDPFLPQSALRELLFQLQAGARRVVLVMDRFDAFCRMITPELGDTLVGLRDSFRDTLSYLIGVRQSLVYLETLELASDFIRLLTTHTCHLGPLSETDARQMIARHTKVGGVLPTEQAIRQLLALTGGYPSLLKSACQWWLLTPNCPPPEHWLAALIGEPAIRHRLHEVWSGLTQEEQQALGEFVVGQERRQGAVTSRLPRHEEVIHALSLKGVCRQAEGRWRCFGMLFEAYVRQAGGLSRGAIWLDEESQTLYHGAVSLDELTPKERGVLEFLIKRPRQRHSYTDLIVSAWSDEERYHGVTNDSLFQVIRGLRQKLEPNPAEPLYLVNWRGKPGGGYLFFPEGRPG